MLRPPPADTQRTTWAFFQPDQALDQETYFSPDTELSRRFGVDNLVRELENSRIPRHSPASGTMAPQKPIKSQ
jgi:hypothetical protein